MLARGGAASGTAGPKPCAAGIKIVTTNQVLSNLNRLKPHALSKPGISTNEKRKKIKGKKKKREKYSRQRRDVRKTG